MTGLDIEDLQRAQRQDHTLTSIIAGCRNNREAYYSHKLENDILYYVEHVASSLEQNKLVVPFSLREHVLSIYHNHELSAAHMDKMERLFKTRFIWADMGADIKRWVQACPKYIKYKRYQPHRHGLLELITSVYPLQKIRADVTGPFKSHI